MRLRSSVTAVLAAVLACSAIVLAPTAAQAKVPLPPSGAMGYSNLAGSCAASGANMRLSANPGVQWLKEPAKKGPTTAGHYLRITVKIQAAAGYGGTLWKTLETKQYKNNVQYLNQFSAENVRAPIGTNLRNGLGQYRVLLIVRVVRDVRLAPDVTAWKFSVASKPFTCNGWDPNPAPAPPLVNAGS